MEDNNTSLSLSEANFCPSNSSLEGTSQKTTDLLYQQKDVKFEWGDSETKLLLDLYHEYLPQVGPLKKFRNKKTMWQKISDEIKLHMNLVRTSGQCETRYKTIIKRKVNAIGNNRTSGEVRVEVPFATEIEKIQSIDDSIQPEFLISANKEELLKNISSNPTVKINKRKSSTNEKEMVKFLKELHDEKEQNKERRHQEKLQLIKELFGSEKKD